MTRNIHAVAKVLIACFLVSVVAGCSTRIPFPSTGEASKIFSSILTTEEQKKALKELSNDEATHRDTAIKEIEEQR